SQPAETNRDRVSRRQVDKFAERRAQLADAALQTLAELGYARTSLREIAQNTNFSHGVLHYYFSDKEDLITHCVRQYEAACVTRYDEIVASASSAEELKREFSAAMAQPRRTDAPMHRLGYDLPNHSLFEASFRPVAGGAGVAGGAAWPASAEIADRYPLFCAGYDPRSWATLPARDWRDGWARSGHAPASRAGYPGGTRGAGLTPSWSRSDGAGMFSAPQCPFPSEAQENDAQTGSSLRFGGRRRVRRSRPQPAANRR